MAESFKSTEERAMAGDTPTALSDDVPLSQTEEISGVSTQQLETPEDAAAYHQAVILAQQQALQSLAATGLLQHPASETSAQGLVLTDSIHGEDTVICPTGTDAPAAQQWNDDDDSNASLSLTALRSPQVTPLSHPLIGPLPLKTKRRSGVHRDTLQIISLNTLRRDLKKNLGRVAAEQEEIHRHRRELDKARVAATKQRSRYTLAQTRLAKVLYPEDLQQPSPESSSTTAELLAEARAADVGIRTTDEALRRREKHIRALEKSFRVKEQTFLRDVDWLLSSARFPVEREVDSHSQTLSSVAPYSDTPSERAAEVVEQYLDAVGQITIIRERLYEFEINHQEAIALRDEDLEDKFAQRQEQAQLPDTPTHSEATFLIHQTILTERFFQDYFDQRLSHAQDLLKNVQLAKSLLARCWEQGETLSEHEENALEDALQYDIDGPIGRMYTITHPGIHRGIMPFDLLQVPYLKPRHRTSSWLLDVRLAMLGQPPSQLDAFVKSIGQARFAKPYFDVLQNRDSVYYQPLNSVSDYRPSHILGRYEGHGTPHETSPYTVIATTMHWTCWSGEACVSSGPASQPDTTNYRVSFPQRWSENAESKSLPEILLPSLFHDPRETLSHSESAFTVHEEEARPDYERTTAPKPRAMSSSYDASMTENFFGEHYGKCSNDYVVQTTSGRMPQPPPNIVLWALRERNETDMG